MKKGIRCNEVRFTNGDKRDRIKFEFVSDDGVTPSSCTVCVGDIDPMTGEKITDVTFFREYYRLADRQVYKNRKAQRPRYTPEEKACREKEACAYRDEFEKQWGYAPTEDDILLHLEEMEKNRKNMSMETIVNRETGESILDTRLEFSMVMEIDQEESPELQALREVASDLTGRKAEVFEAMLQHMAGGKVRIKFSDVAKKWGVSCKQITKDQVKIMAMVRKKAEELRKCM